MKTDGLPTLGQLNVLNRAGQLNGTEKITQEYLVAVHNAGLTFETASAAVAAIIERSKADQVAKLRAKLAVLEA